MAEKEFRVNKHIVLRLEEDKTNIYVEGELFRQCKYLLLINPHNEAIQWEINSIDEAAELLNNDLHEEILPEDVGLTPEVEFWGHCSNLQVWVEHNYNTDILHSNLSLSLLEKLKELGDAQAKKMFKGEVIKWYLAGDNQYRENLGIMGFLQDFSDEELFHLDLDEDEFESLRFFSKEINKPMDSITLQVQIRDKKVFGLSPSLYTKIKKIPEVLLEFESLRILSLRSGGIEEIPDWLGELAHLRFLDLSNNNIMSIPPSIKKMRNLKELILSGNSIEIIPETLSYLRNLTKLNLNYNRLKKLPNTFNKLSRLNELDLVKNGFSKVPEVLENMPLIHSINMAGNPIREIPEWVVNTKNLKSFVMNIKQGKEFYPDYKIPAKIKIDNRECFQ